MNVSVVIPTIGRPQLLRACLRSLARCEPRAAEIIVVDQSRDSGTAAAVAEFSEAGVRVIKDPGRGRGRACNIGIRASANDLVLMTDDDCTVASDWVGVAIRLMAQRPTGIVTGRVLPVGDPVAVPSTKTDPTPQDYTGTRARGVLYAGNMACSRRSMLELGGFDEGIVPSSEDNEFCHRWLRAGRSLRYEPQLTIWHHDWRTPPELRRHYRNYARGEGMFYAKYLRAGDFSVVRYLVFDLRAGIRGVVAALVRGGPQWRDWRLGVLAGLPVGLWQGWRTFAPGKRPGSDSGGS